MASLPPPSLPRPSDGMPPGPGSPGKPRLLDQVRAEIRLRHYSLRTEETYLDWIRRFIFFHGKRHPADMGLAEVAGFLPHLALERGVAAATQIQAKAALLFLTKHVLGIELPWLKGVVQPAQRLPVVLAPGEVRRLLERMNGVTGLVAQPLFGTGVRLTEGCACGSRISISTGRRCWCGPGRETVASPLDRI